MTDTIDKIKKTVKNWFATNVEKKENPELYGRFRLRKIRDGEIIHEEVIDNVIVNDGLAAVTALLGSGLSTASGNGKFSHIAIGTGSTAASSSDSSLVTEHAREAATVTSETTNTTDDTLRLDSTFSIGSSVTIEESGVFNAASGGEMLCRQTTGSQSLQSGDSLQVTWDITSS